MYILILFHFVSTRVSNELGAGRSAAAKLAGCVVVSMATIEGLLLAIILVLIRNVWGYAYSSEPEVVEYLANMLPIVAISSFLDGLQCVLSGSHFILFYNYMFFFSYYVSFHLTPTSFEMKIEVELEPKTYIRVYN